MIAHRVHICFGSLRIREFLYLMNSCCFNTCSHFYLMSITYTMFKIKTTFLCLAIVFFSYKGYSENFTSAHKLLKTHYFIEMKAGERKTLGVLKFCFSMRSKINLSVFNLFPAKRRWHERSKIKPQCKSKLKQSSTLFGTNLNKWRIWQEISSDSTSGTFITINQKGNVIENSNLLERKIFSSINVAHFWSYKISLFENR